MYTVLGPRYSVLCTLCDIAFANVRAVLRDKSCAAIDAVAQYAIVFAAAAENMRLPCITCNFSIEYGQIIRPDFHFAIAHVSNFGASANKNYFINLNRVRID